MKTLRSPLIMTELEESVTGRSTSLFAPDMAGNEEALFQAYGGKTVLITGAAGTIAKATISQILRFHPSKMILVDTNENGLADLIRWIRNTQSDRLLPQLEPRLCDITSPQFVEMTMDGKEPNFLCNFAAVKHVRSERDPLSLWRMFQVNVLGTMQVRLLAERCESERIFSVSTDKAANPVNLMGASKRVMEAVLLQDSQIPSASARFANVAFSQGSLLDSWIDRLERGEPLPVPRDTKRYFLSSEEAGQICALVTALLPSEQVAIPTILDGFEIQSLEQTVKSVLDRLGLTPSFITSVNEAKNSNESWEVESKEPYVLLTERDTEGEKSFEEFLERGDSAIEWGMRGLVAIQPRTIPQELLFTFIDWLKQIQSSEAVVPEKDQMINRMFELLPNFDYMQSENKLDNRI